MTIRKIFAIIFFIYISAFLIHAFVTHKTVYGDGIYYYSYARSIVFDRNVDFTNEYQKYNVTRPLAPNGLAGNKYAIGPALFWMPVLTMMKPVIGGTGYELPYQIAVGMTGVMAALAGLILLYAALTALFSESVALVTIMTITFATNLLFYGSIDTVNSHPFSFLVAAAFVYKLIRQQTLKTLQRSNAVEFGILIGLLAIIRLQDVVLGILVVPFLAIPTVFPFLGGIGFGFFPQMLAWKLVYGSFIALPYLREDVGFDFMHPQILNVLFSPNNGLFFWTPMIFLASYGLILLFFRTKSRLLKLFPIAFICAVYLTGSWRIWWQGASFSGRMFVSVLPVLAFGLAEIFGRLGSTSLMRFLCLAFSIVNCGLMLYFLTVN